MITAQQEGYRRFLLESERAHESLKVTGKNTEPHTYPADECEVCAQNLHRIIGRSITAAARSPKVAAQGMERSV